MQKFRLLLLAVLCTTIGYSQLANYASESALTSPMTFGQPEFGVEAVTAGTLYSNGPYFNVAGSPDISLLQDLTLFMGTYGAGHQLAAGNRVADDWVVTEEVNVDNIQFYSYQTGSTTVSTINHISLAIWDGDPSNPTSTIIWGNQTSNVFTSSVWSGAYRALESTPGDTSRPIMVTTVNTPGLTLQPGTYWLDWDCGGTLASGPWAPPIAILGNATTGNSMQSIAGVWAPLTDGGTFTPQGLPFEVNGTVVGGGGDELLTIDLTTENQVTITATSAPSASTASGGTTTGFLFENFFASAGTQGIGTPTYVGTPTLTAASVPTDNTPSLFRNANTDPGMNIWSYSATSTTTFTAGSQAFTGTATWSITPELYAAMLTAPDGGDIYFPADDSTDIATATLLGTYSVIKPSTEPGAECDITYAGSLEDGLGALNTLALASDFNIGADESMSVERITFNVYSNVTSVNVSFHADNAGTPGAQIAAPVSIVPTSQTLIGVSPTLSNIYEVVLDLPTAQNFDGGAAGANFWMAISTVVGSEGLGNYWEFSNTINNGTNFFYSVDGGVVWTDAGTAGFIEDGAFILEGTCGGQEPPGDNDDCDGAIAVSCGDTVTGTTADATDSGGNAAPDRFYSFTGTGDVENVTVSLCGSSYDTYIRVFSDCTLTNEIAFNDDFCGLQSQVTFESDGTSTYVIMVEGFSSNTGDYTMAVTCSEPPVVGEPDYPCFQGDGLSSNGFEDGYNITAGGTFRNADDFIVDNTFELQYIRMNLFMQPGATAASTTFNIRADEGGAPSESNIVATFTATPTSQGVLGSNFGLDISQVEYVLTTPVDMTAGTYWLQPEVNASNAGPVYWEMTSTGSLGSASHTSEAGGAWTANAGFNAVFFVAGVCGDEPVDCGQETLSNGFEDGHGNLHLLKVANDFVVEQNESFSVESFEFNVIIPTGGTIDALDYYFYQDTAGSGPGADAGGSGLFVTPTNTEVIGNAFGTYDVVRVSVDLPAPHVLNGSTSADTVYWLGVMIYTGQAASFWEGTSMLNTPNEGYLELDGVWQSFSAVFGAAFDGVYEISGTCATLGIDDMNSFDFAYYPNPVKDVLNITSNKKVENVSVYNLAGQQVLANAKVSNGQINVSALSSGVYVFRATLQGGQVETFKIIKK